MDQRVFQPGRIALELRIELLAGRGVGGGSGADRLEIEAQPVDAERHDQADRKLAAGRTQAEIAVLAIEVGMASGLDVDLLTEPECRVQLQGQRRADPAQRWAQRIVDADRARHEPVARLDDEHAAAWPLVGGQGRFQQGARRIARQHQRPLDLAQPQRGPPQHRHQDRRDAGPDHLGHAGGLDRLDEAVDHDDLQGSAVFATACGFPPISNHLDLDAVTHTKIRFRQSPRPERRLHIF